jgi:ubiquinone/menaquinone biosynthesis C-methylase UbiE
VVVGLIPESGPHLVFVALFAQGAPPSRSRDVGARGRKSQTAPAERQRHLASLEPGEGGAAVRRSRRAYYDRFSRFYDRFVALHSRDSEGAARRFLAERLPVADGGRVLDLCTGTASVLPSLGERVGASGRVVGLDFSRGMLSVAAAKVRGAVNIRLVEADAAVLPFATESFDAVTCSHAFYELKGEAQEHALVEIRRVLRPCGAFLMMEHDVPGNVVIRMLFYLRLTAIGAGKALAFLRREQEILRSHFARVEKSAAPGGRSKLLVCWK